jgi:hypothetical protein
MLELGNTGILPLAWKVLGNKGCGDCVFSRGPKVV